MAARIDVHIRHTVAIARVDTKATHKIRMKLLDGVDRVHDDAAVRSRYPPISVRIDDDVRGVTILVTAVAGRALHLRVVRGSSEAGVHVERNHRIGWYSTHLRYFRNDQLELVEQPRIQRNVLRPDFSLRVVGQEVAEMEVLAHAELQVTGSHLQEARGPVMFAAEP